MRLLAITNCFPRSLSDTRAPWNRQQFLALARHHQIRLIVPVPFTQSGMRNQRCQIDWSIADDFLALYPTFWFTPKCLGHHYGPLMLRSIQSTVDYVLADFTPDAVLGCWADPDGYAAVQIARKLGVPALLKVVGSDVLILGQDKKRRPRIAQTLQSAAGVFAVSQDLANHVTGMGVDPSNVHVIPEGVDRNLFYPGSQSAARRHLGFLSQRRIILFVGNLLISKGAEVLLKGCGILRDQGVPFSCCFIGQGPDETRLKRLSASLKLDHQVVFAGTCAHEDLADWYRAADVVTLPSFSEGIPNTLREAICCGRPFVATNVGGIPEISPPEISGLIAPGDVPALAAALAEMLKNPPTVPENIASEYCISWKESAAMIDGLLQKLVTTSATEHHELAGSAH